jgi:hypothetical protein
MAASAILAEWWEGSHRGRRRGKEEGRSGGRLVWRAKGAPSSEKYTFQPRRVLPGGVATETAKVGTGEVSSGSSGSAGTIPRKLARTPEGAGGAAEGTGLVARIVGVKPIVEGEPVAPATVRRGP